MLQISLRSYGEEELALAVPNLTDAELCEIQQVASRLYPACGGPLHPKGPSDMLTRALIKADCQAAIQVLEGAKRPLKRKRSRLGLFASPKRDQ
jgi:hypothetical protein